MIGTTVNVIGAGLAGCEAALRLAKCGVKVRLFEMKPARKSAAHSSDGFAELVCSNSLKAARTASSSGLLKAEMRRFGSVCINILPRRCFFPVKRLCMGSFCFKFIPNIHHESLAFCFSF